MFNARQSKPIIMKRLTVLVVSLSLATFAAQAQTTFGIKAGVLTTATRIDIQEDDAEANLDGTRTGFQVGGVADIKLSPNWSFQPNLNFVMKNGSLIAFGSGKVNMLTLDVPLNILYRHNGFFIGGGPNFSYGLSAKLKPFDNTDPETNLYEKQGSANAPFNRFEIGVNGTLGYEFPSGFNLSATFTPGLSDLLNEEQDGFKIRTRTFGLNFGYTFGKMSKK